MPDDHTGVGRAAHELGLSPQGVRDLIRAGKLTATKGPSGRWQIEASSVKSYLAAHGRKKHRADLDAPEINRKLVELTRSVDILREFGTSATRLLEATERERDKYRAEAAAVRAAAIGLVAASQETQSAVSGLLEVVSQQRDALVQLLAPGSPEDLIH